MNCLVIGGSVLGRSVIEIAAHMNDIGIVGVLDDAIPVGALIDGVPCLGPIAMLRVEGNENPDFGVVIAVGDPLLRKEIYLKIKYFNPFVSFVTIIDPRSVICRSVEIGAGSIVFPGCVLGPAAQIGHSCILNSNVTVGASATVGNFSTICPGANVGSEAKVGEGAYIGMGAAIAQQVQMDDGSVLGALSFAKTRIAANAVAVGRPAKVRKLK